MTNKYGVTITNMVFVSTKFNDCTKYEYDLLDSVGCRGEWTVGVKQKSVCINKIPRKKYMWKI